jgi:segregation and condensation protein B
VEKSELKKVLECLFFVAAEPLDADELSSICQEDSALVKDACAELSAEYAVKGFFLREIAAGWQFFSSPDYLPYVEKLYRPKIHKLSKAGLETLAIIAYRQPLTRLDVENTRKINSDGVMNTLLEKNLIKEVGRRNTPGKPILYGTTKEFLIFFGLSSLADLPPLEEFSVPSAQD